MNTTSNTDQLEALLRETETKAAELREKLEAARRKPEKWHPKWHPKAVDGFCVYAGGDLSIHRHPVPKNVKAGSYYPTQGAADAANRRITFFRRLCALTTELNPSGKIAHGNHVCRLGGRWRSYSSPQGSSFCDSVFETESAAQKAVEIMNRDGWTLENGGGFFDE